MKPTSIAKLVFAGIIALVGLSAILGSFYTVEQGTRAVVLRNGAMSDVSAPGLHWKVPFIDETKDMSVQEQSVSYKLAAYSQDQQNADVIVSVNYSLDPAEVATVYTKFGLNYVNKTIAKQTPKRFKEQFGKFTAERIVNDRTALGSEVEDAVRESMKDTGIIIESVQIEDVEFSHEYEASIEKRMKAEVDKAKAVAEGISRRTAADAAAYEVTAAAKAEAEAVKLKGEAEADAIKAKANALKANTDLVALRAVEKWDGKLPVQMTPNGALPFLNLKGISN